MTAHTGASQPRSPLQPGTIIDRIGRPKNQLIFDLLHGAGRNGDEVLAEARRLRMDLSQPRAVLLVDASDYALGGANSGLRISQLGDVQVRSREIISAIVSFFKLPHEAICADLGEGLIAVLKASNSRNLDDWVDGPQPDAPISPSWANLSALKRAANDLLDMLVQSTNESISIGIGRYHPGIVGLAASFADARAALVLGQRLDGRNRVHCLDELGVVALVGLEDERTKVSLARHLLSPLDGEPELIETLDAFFAENCSPATTARRLSIHRNTLTYRFAKIASLTGLDPRRFDDAVQIRLARVLQGLDRRPNDDDETWKTERNQRNGSH